MVAGGIGAGIVIVILEVLYYKHKGWRKQQQKVLKKTTDVWQGKVQEKRNERGDDGRPENGSMDNNGTSSNGETTIRNGHASTGLRNPTYKDDIDSNINAWKALKKL